MYHLQVYERLGRWKDSFNCRLRFLESKGLVSEERGCRTLLDFAKSWCKKCEAEVWLFCSCCVPCPVVACSLEKYCRPPPCAFPVAPPPHPPFQWQHREAASKTPEDSLREKALQTKLERHEWHE